MWSRASSRSTGRRFDPRREQQRVGPVSDRGRVAGRVERGQDPLRAATVAEDDPRPTEAVDDVEREQRVVGRRSRPARRRCWRARLGRTRGTRLAGRCAHPASTIAAASANHAACAARARSVSPASVIASSAKARMLSSSRYRTGVDAPSSSTMTSDRLASRPTTSMRGRRPARRALRGRTRPPAAARRRRRWRAPTARAGRRGTTARSSTGSSP